jgi:hypothetical protein
MVGKALVKVQGSGGADEETLKTFLKLVNLDAIEKGAY